MTIADPQLQHIESLWSQFKEERVDDPALHIGEYCDRYPQQADDIRRIFPLMIELDALAEDSANSFETHRLPDRIGGYPIIRQIGSGGMGLVYEAHCESLRERIAIKVISSERIDAKGIERFTQEARAVASLHHTNIVPIYQFGVDGDSHFYTMRLIDGPNLAEVVSAAQPEDSQSDASRTEVRTEAIELLDRLRNNWAMIADLGLQAASALSHAHNREILHRDIKPANLLVDSTGKLWITDFGLAKRTLDENSLTSLCQAVGTPRYMAPEQIRGISDARGDLYSLGLTLYELITLRKVDADSREALSSDSVSEFRSVEKRVPAELQRIIRKALAPVPRERYQSASAMVEDLSAFVRGVRRREQRRKLRAGLAWAGVLMIAAIGVTTPWLRRAEPIGNEPARIDSQSTLDTVDWSVEVSENNAGGVSIPDSFGDLSAAAITGDDAVHFQLAAEQRQVRFRTEPDFEVPVDRDMDNVYRLCLAGKTIAIRVDDANEPPSFDDFVFESDGETILLSRQQLASAWSIDVRDDRDTPFNGLCLSIDGGADRDSIKMTPQGVFVFDQSMRGKRPSDADADGVYEFLITASDQTHIFMVRLEQRPDGHIALLQERIVPGAKLESIQLSAECLIRRDVIDIATADGKTFYHIHADERGSTALGISTLMEDGTFESKVFSDDCGIPQEAIGLATCDGVSFYYLARRRGSAQGVMLFQATLGKDHTFTSQLCSEDCRVSYALEGFSWIDTTRMQHIRRQPTGERSLYYSFLSSDRDNRFANMRLHETRSQFYLPSRGQAAWIQRSPTSNQVTRPVRIRVQ